MDASSHANHEHRRPPSHGERPSRENWDVSGEANPPIPSAMLYADQITEGDEPAPVKDRQDEIMTEMSSEGRPPSWRLRVLQWRWFAIAAAAIGLLILGWIALRGVPLEPMGLLLAFGGLLVLGSSPAWGAGLLRGKEERAARRRARREMIPAAKRGRPT